MVVAATSELLVNFIDASIINAWLLHRRVYHDAQFCYKNRKHTTLKE